MTWFLLSSLLLCFHLVSGLIVTSNGTLENFDPFFVNYDYQIVSFKLFYTFLSGKKKKKKKKKKS